LSMKKAGLLVDHQEKLDMSQTNMRFNGKFGDHTLGVDGQDRINPLRSCENETQEIPITSFDHLDSAVYQVASSKLT